MECRLIVDNTFATPVNCHPFQWGADIVTHSTTKYMDGHGLQVGGAIVDSGNFDWEAYGDKYHGLTQPDESYHGVVYTKQFGKKAYITKATSQLMRDLGSIPSPNNCFLLNIGLETLPLRMERHCFNAQKTAEFLSSHEKVSKVIYPGLPGDKYHALAVKYLPNGSCGVISFELKGGREGSCTLYGQSGNGKYLYPCSSIKNHGSSSRKPYTPPDERRTAQRSRSFSGNDSSFCRN